jgi:hypothetical protein
MFAALVINREPLGFQDVPALVLYWIQAAGGWAALGLFLWVVAVELRLVPRTLVLLAQAVRGPDLWVEGNRRQNSRGQAVFFTLCVIVSGVCYLALFVTAMVEKRPPLPPPGPGAADAAAALAKLPWTRLQYFQSSLWTLGGLAALAAIGLPFLINLTQLNLRRIGAIARLSFTEALRKRVVFAFVGVLLLLFLFGAWYVQSKDEDQVRTYVSLVDFFMTRLLLIVAVVLAGFSIPADIRNQTIHTVLTKPVQRFEVVLGRFFGFVGLLTVILVIMGALGLIYILRNVNDEAAAESLQARVPAYGELSFENTSRTDRGESVGREWEYRSYISSISPSKQQPFAVWNYPSSPAGLAQRPVVRCEFGFDVYRLDKGFENKGIDCTFYFQTWQFKPEDAKDYFRRRDEEKKTRKCKLTDKKLDALRDVGVPDAVLAKLKPLKERSAKAPFERKLFLEDLAGLLDKEERARYQDYVLNRAQLTDDEINDLLAEQFGYYEKVGKKIDDYHTQSIDVPGGLFRNAEKAGKPTKDPALQVRVKNNSASGQVGMARYDLYFRQDDPEGGLETFWFALNFCKSCIGLWFQMVLVCGLAVFLSTYLSGVITILIVGLLYIGGWCHEFIESVGKGTNFGGGPLEAAYRIMTRYNLTAQLDDVTQKRLNFGDEGFRWLIRRVQEVLPNVEHYYLTSSVKEGFNIPASQLWYGLLVLVGYLLPWAVLAFFLMKWREVASET